MTHPFHLALPTKSINETELFYVEILQCDIGRRDVTWIDFNLYGHQLVFHQCDTIIIPSGSNLVDNKTVRVPHFGIVLTMLDWKQLSKRLQQNSMSFLIDPYIRFEGLPGEQATMFFEDNNGYALEFKAFKNDGRLFM